MRIYFYLKPNYCLLGEMYCIFEAPEDKNNVDIGCNFFFASHYLFKTILCLLCIFLAFSSQAVCCFIANENMFAEIAY